MWPFLWGSLAWSLLFAISLIVGREENFFGGDLGGGRMQRSAPATGMGKTPSPAGSKDPDKRGGNGGSGGAGGNVGRRWQGTAGQFIIVINLGMFVQR